MTTEVSFTPLWSLECGGVFFTQHPVDGVCQSLQAVRPEQEVVDLAIVAGDSQSRDGAAVAAVRNTAFDHNENYRDWVFHGKWRLDCRTGEVTRLDETGSLLQ